MNQNNVIMILSFSVPMRDNCVIDT